MNKIMNNSGREWPFENTARRAVRRDCSSTYRFILGFSGLLRPRAPIDSCVVAIQPFLACDNWEHDLGACSMSISHREVSVFYSHHPNCLKAARAASKQGSHPQRRRHQLQGIAQSTAGFLLSVGSSAASTTGAWTSLLLRTPKSSPQGSSPSAWLMAVTAAPVSASAAETVSGACVVREG